MAAAGRPVRGEADLRNGVASARIRRDRGLLPVPRYPEVSWLRPATYVYHRPDPEHAPPGLHTHYLEYLTLPLAGRLVNGLSVEAVLAPALRDFRPDLILCYWLYPTGWAAVNVGKRMGVPVIVGSRGSDLHRIPAVDAVDDGFDAAARVRGGDGDGGLASSGGGAGSRTVADALDPKRLRRAALSSTRPPGFAQRSEPAG